MSFGYSVGDFVTLGQLAWKVYKSCKDAPESFSNISQEVLSLHTVLKEAEEILSEQSLSASKQVSLKTVSDGCYRVLQDLQCLLARHESLGVKSKRTWDRLRWGSQDIEALRSRLISNTVLLVAFIRYARYITESKYVRGSC
jgi:hypothetical protein